MDVGLGLRKCSWPLSVSSTKSATVGATAGYTGRAINEDVLRSTFGGHVKLSKTYILRPKPSRMLLQT